MNTVLVTNGNLSSLLALGDYLKVYGGDISAIFITTHLPSERNNYSGVLRMLKESGFRYTYFKVYTNVILPKKLKLKGYPVSVAQYMKSLGHKIPIIYTGDINSQKCIEQIEGFKPDVLLSFSSTVRFSDELVRVATRSSINAHYALLPGYAGLSPYFWYLRNKEKEAGVTLHQITSRLDAGPIIEQKKFSLDKINSVLSVLLNQAQLISPMLINYFNGQTDEAIMFQQDLSKRSYYRHPKKEDVKNLSRNNNVFYDHFDLTQIKKTLSGFKEQNG